MIPLSFRLFALSVLVSSLAAGAQDAAPLTTLKLETRLVSLSATIRDKKGEPVHDLKPADFVLLEDGKPQTIRNLNEGSELPLTLALLVDTSGSQKHFIDDETKASELFFPQMMKTTEDRAVLVQFDNNVLQLQKMTNSVYDLEKGLLHLSEPHASVLNNGRGGGTLLFDAVYVTAKAVLGKDLGRRAMVILTDGGDNGSRTTISDAINEALRADITIYSVYYAERYDDFGKAVCQELADQTGGQVFTVGRHETLEQIYAKIAETMRQQYVLAYRPPDSTPGKYHKLELKPMDKHLKVQARTGYFTPKAPVATGPDTAAK